MQSIHQYKVPSIDNGEIKFEDFKGKKILVVNVASECGYTPQYQQLQELYKEFQDKLIVVGFPSNDFGGQEPGSNDQIKTFCTSKYGVTFPLATKTSVSGKDQNAIYKWLTSKELNGVSDSTVNWNFQKYLIDENGQLIRTLPSSISPFDDEILDWVNQ